MAEVIAVTTPALTKQFVEFQYAFYANSPCWVPPLRRDEYRRLDPRHNPFLAHADMRLWIARSNGRATGRIAAIDDQLHNQTHGERTTWFGFFEAADPDTARALFDVVEAHARTRGSESVRGPVNPSLNESAGLLIDAFDSDPYLLMPYNPPEYAGYIEAAGYGKIKDLLAFDLDLTVPLGERITRIAERVRRRHGISVRCVDLKQFDRDLDIMQSIYKAAWSDNWGFVAPTDAETRQLALDLKPVLDPNLVIFAEMAGRPVGCAVSLPDLNQVLKRMGGNLFPFGLFHFLRRRAIIDKTRLVLLGVMPEARRIGLYPLLVAEVHGRAVARGYRRGEMSWTLEDNDAINEGIIATGGRRYKTYRLYDKRLV